MRVCKILFHFEQVRGCYFKIFVWRVGGLFVGTVYTGI